MAETASSVLLRQTGFEDEGPSSAADLIDVLEVLQELRQLFSDSGITELFMFILFPPSYMVQTILSDSIRLLLKTMHLCWLHQGLRGFPRAAGIPTGS